MHYDWQHNADFKWGSTKKAKGKIREEQIVQVERVNTEISYLSTCCQIYLWTTSCAPSSPQKRPNPTPSSPFGPAMGLPNPELLAPEPTTFLWQHSGNSVSHSRRLHTGGYLLRNEVSQSPGMADPMAINYDRKFSRFRRDLRLTIREFPRSSPEYVHYYIWLWVGLDDSLEVTKVPKRPCGKVQFHGQVLMSPHHTE